MTPKIAGSALPGDPIAVTSFTNHSIFIKWPYVKFLVIKRGFLHPKATHRPQIRPELSKKPPIHNHPENSMFRPVRGSDSCYVHWYLINHFIFIKWPSVKLSGLKRGFLHHEMAPWPQIRPELTKKHAQPKSPLKIARSSLSGDPTDVRSVTNYSIFIKWL